MCVREREREKEKEKEKKRERVREPRREVQVEDTDCHQTQAHLNSFMHDQLAKVLRWPRGTIGHRTRVPQPGLRTPQIEGRHRSLFSCTLQRVPDPVYLGHHT